jgi:TolA-binding protein
MTEASLSAGVGPLLLVVGLANLIIAALTLRNVRSSVGLPEYHAENLRREQPRLLTLLAQERQTLKEGIEQEWERHLLEARRQDEQSSRELLLLRREQERLAEELRRESERREQERRARLGTEARIRQLEREIQELQKAQRGSSSLVPVRALEDRIEARELPREEPLPAQEARGDAGAMPPARPTGASKPARVPPRDKKPGRGVWHPHPDDDTGKGEDMPEKRDRETVGAPVQMYRKHYDKYLDNYLGYVELAEELYRTRGDGKATDGTFGDREWEERLRRILDGIERTTARLDILEQHNPELVTDARISHRASVARRHAQLP